MTLEEINARLPHFDTWQNATIEERERFAFHMADINGDTYSITDLEVAVHFFVLGFCTAHEVLGGDDGGED